MSLRAEVSSKFRRSPSHQARQLQAERLEDRRLLALADLQLSPLLPSADVGQPDIDDFVAGKRIGR